MAKRKPIARSKASLEESTVSDKLPVEKAFCLRYGSAIITAGEREKEIPIHPEVRVNTEQNG